MGFSNNSCPNTNLNKMNHFPVRESRPRMLKDFLIDDSNSCSSSGFASFPRKPLDSKLRALIQNDPESAMFANLDDAKNLHRRNPKPNSFSLRISALQAVINVVKSISFTSVKPPSILPRSLSWKLSKRRSNDSTFTRGSGKGNKEITQVKVKDIIRWTSFGDLEVEEESPPLDCRSTSTSNPSSWCDSDFSTTSEYLPSRINGDDEVKNFSPCVGEDLMDATTTKTTHAQVVPKGEEKREQHSPVSVIDFCKLEEEDEEDSRSLLDQSFADVERTKHELVEKIRRFDSLSGLNSINLENWLSMEEPTSSEEEEGEETNDDDFEEEDDDDDEVEEKAWELLNHIRGGSPHPGSCVNKLLLDFFREELAHQKDKMGDDDEVGYEISNRAKAWMNGEHGLWMGWEVKDKRKDYVKEMERGVNWIKCDREAQQEEIAVAIGNETLGLLVDELLFDLIGALQWI